MIERVYHKNGKLRWERPFHEGQEHGVQRYWREDGQLYCEYPFHEGQRHGVAKWWWKSGFIRKDYYLYDDEVTEEEYRHHELTVALSEL